MPPRAWTCCHATQATPSRTQGRPNGTGRTPATDCLIDAGCLLAAKTLCFWKAQGNGARTFQITRLSDHKKRSLLEGSRVQRAARARRVHLLSFLGPLRSLRPSRTLAKGGQLANQTAILRSSNCRCCAVRVSGRRFCWPAYSRRPLRGGGGTVLTGHFHSIVCENRRESVGARHNGNSRRLGGTAQLQCSRSTRTRCGCGTDGRTTHHRELRNRSIQWLGLF